MTKISSLKKKKQEMSSLHARVPKELKDRAEAALKVLGVAWVDLITHALNLAISEAEKAPKK